MPMPGASSDLQAEKQSLFQYAKAWGENSFPPTLLATLITAQHIRPFRLIPMLFPPILLFSSYLNLQGFKKDSAGMASAWSGAYLVLAMRRRQSIGRKLRLGGAVRGATIGLSAVNAIAGGWAYWSGKRNDEDLKE